MALAACLYHDSLALYRDLGSTIDRVWCLEGLAALAAVQEQPEQAGRLWAAAQQARTILGMPLSPGDRRRFEQYVAPARARLGSFRWATIMDDALPLELAITYTLEHHTTTD